MVKYGPTEKREHTSFLTDMSDTGLCIKTNTVYRPGTKIFMSVEVEDKEYPAEGIVMWAKIVPPQLVRVTKNGMGIQFTFVDMELLEYYYARLT